jgi:hypothetical protein
MAISGKNTTTIGGIKNNSYRQETQLLSAGNNSGHCEKKVV